MSGKFLKQLSQEVTSSSGSAEGKKGKQKKGRGKKHQTTADEPLQGSGWEIKFMSTSEVRTHPLSPSLSHSPSLAHSLALTLSLTHSHAHSTQILSRLSKCSTKNLRVFLKISLLN